MHRNSVFNLDFTNLERQGIHYILFARCPTGSVRRGNRRRHLAEDFQYFSESTGVTVQILHQIAPESFSVHRNSVCNPDFTNLERQGIRYILFARCLTGSV